MNDAERLTRLRKKANALTDSPGVYLMKNKSGQIIYVGKAKRLKNRVTSYFRSDHQQNEKVRKMVSLVEDFDYIVTDSEFEALVLECSLIKQHSPKYNILLKDDKGYHYIRVTNEPYPRIREAKQKNDTDRFYGPYTSGFLVKQAVDEAQRIFRLPTCGRKFPQEFGRGRACLNYHIGRCMGVCRGKISQKEYAATVEQAVQFLRKGSDDILRQLKEEMAQASDALDFERAAQLRDRIGAIEAVNDGQKIFRDSGDQDVIAVAQSEQLACAAVLRYREGRLVDKQHFFLSDTALSEQLRDDFLLQYYHGSNEIPPRILLDLPLGDEPLMEEYLTRLRGKKAAIHVPQRGEQKKLTLMALENAAEQLSDRLNRKGKDVAALDELQKLLALPAVPARIEAYDVSNWGDSGIVGGMVVFQNGKPEKSAYRRFAMKEVKTQDDYASMREMLDRRLTRLTEQPDDPGFGQKPDLILLDGGAGHVSVVSEVLKAHRLAIPLFGMVKDGRHRTRAIAAAGGEISMKPGSAAFRLVAGIQDEVHRYAIQYQKQLRKKTTLSLRLTDCPGIGEAKARDLLLYFGALERLKAAPVEELCRIAKLSPEKGEVLHRFVETL